MPESKEVLAKHIAGQAIMLAANIGKEVMEALADDEDIDLWEALDIGGVVSEEYSKLKTMFVTAKRLEFSADDILPVMRAVGQDLLDKQE